MRTLTHRIIGNLIIVAAITGFILAAVALIGYLDESSTPSQTESSTPKIRYNPYTQARGLFHKARAQHKNEDLFAAIQTYDQAIALYPRFAEAWYYRGLAKHDLKQYDIAITDYSTAIYLEMNTAELYYNRGVARMNSTYNQDLSAIYSDFSTAIRLNPSMANAYHNRGLTRYRQAEEVPLLSLSRRAAPHQQQYYVDAVNDFSEAIRLDPTPVTYNCRGLVKQAMGLIEDAERDFQTSKKLAKEVVDKLLQILMRGIKKALA